MHHAEEAVHAATGALGGFSGWLTNTSSSAVVGAVVVTVVHLLPRRSSATAH